MKVLVLGAGRMGYAVVYDLIFNSSNIESVTVVDSVSEKAEQIARKFGRVTSVAMDITDEQRVIQLMMQHDVAISCVDYWHNFRLSELAIIAKTHFCDLGGNIFVVEKQLRLHEKASAAGINIVPDCGLAPGMVSILAADGARRFDQLDRLHIRVGGLPQNPKPPLDYQLVFSVEGLINEYVEPARIIRNGEITEVDSMTEIESIEFEGFQNLEAFQTSGGTSTLPFTFLGKVRDLDYKTIRHAGHCEKFKTMIDLGLCSGDPLDTDGQKIIPRKVLAELLKKNLPANEPDFVLVRLEFYGKRNQNYFRLRYSIVDKFDEETQLSAMMRTTAFPASIVAQMLVRGEVSGRGAIPQELLIDPEEFIKQLKRRNINIVEEITRLNPENAPS
ncbi:MAG: saccharopine dehydrogenase [Acidobacteria bacterium]|nr:MAG: saccharopine dehydrogenase [Acidobacteriota bacterium]